MKVWQKKDEKSAELKDKEKVEQLMALLKGRGADLVKVSNLVQEMVSKLAETMEWRWGAIYL